MRVGVAVPGAGIGFAIKQSVLIKITLKLRSLPDEIMCLKKATLRKLFLIAALLLAAPLQASADPAAAVKCQASLDPEAKLIYDTVSPLVTPTTVIRDAIKQQTRSLVIAGKVNRATARDSAKAAGKCFRILRQ
jgi:hypothetical protein